MITSYRHSSGRSPLGRSPFPRGFGRGGGLGLVALLFGSGLGGCGTGSPGVLPPSGVGPASPEASSPVVQPGAPGQAGRTLSPAAVAELPRPPHTDADVRFMRDMIGHHAQALEMTVLVPERSQREDIRLLARRIEISQASEIALMRRWLEDRWEEAPDPLGAGHGGGHHGGGHEAGHAAGHGGDSHAHPHGGMPGMLTRDQLHRLASATGDEFDRIFLEYMIYHHEGALTMVAELFASPGAGQGGEIFEFASHVDADQRIEIARMTRMLNAVP
jgi:uncharacterized protein (DUF305 family)